MFLITKHSCQPVFIYFIHFQKIMGDFCDISERGNRLKLKATLADIITDTTKEWHHWHH